MPIISRAGETMRALMPRMVPLLSSMTCMVRSRSMLLGEKMSGVVASPVRQMCRKGMISVALPGMMWAGKPP